MQNNNKLILKMILNSNTKKRILVWGGLFLCSLFGSFEAAIAKEIFTVSYTIVDSIDPGSADRVGGTITSKTIKIDFENKIQANLRIEELKKDPSVGFIKIAEKIKAEGMPAQIIKISPLLKKEPEYVLEALKIHRTIGTNKIDPEKLPNTRSGIIYTVHFTQHTPSEPNSKVLSQIAAEIKLDRPQAAAQIAQLLSEDPSMGHIRIHASQKQNDGSVRATSTKRLVKSPPSLKEAIDSIFGKVSKRVGAFAAISMGAFSMFQNQSVAMAIESNLPSRKKTSDLEIASPYSDQQNDRKLTTSYIAN